MQNGQILFERSARRSVCTRLGAAWIIIAGDFGLPLDIIAGLCSSAALAD